jgi:hypothetical protein
MQAETEEDARREARRQATARQLEEEAARRDAARQANTLPLSLSNARRVRSWGRIHPNDELLRYAEAWALKIQFNAPVETVREVASQPSAHHPDRDGGSPKRRSGGVGDLRGLQRRGGNR